MSHLPIDPSLPASQQMLQADWRQGSTALKTARWQWPQTDLRPYAEPFSGQAFFILETILPFTSPALLPGGQFEQDPDSDKGPGLKFETPLIEERWLAQEIQGDTLSNRVACRLDD